MSIVGSCKLPKPDAKAEQGVMAEAAEVKCHLARSRATQPMQRPGLASYRHGRRGLGQGQMRLLLVLAVQVPCCVLSVALVGGATRTQKSELMPTRTLFASLCPLFAALGPGVCGQQM